MKPPRDFKKAIKDASIGTNEATDKRILKMMREAYDQSSHRPAVGQVTSRKPAFLGPASGLAVVAAVIVVILVVANPFSSPNGGLAFGEVLANMAGVQTFHAIERDDGKIREIWAKRPNMLRCENSADVIEISNGPTMWVVDTAANTATQRPSYYFKSAQRNGLDVVDYFLRMDFAGGLSGFFSEGPVERIAQEGKLFDVYRMEFTTQYGAVHFEALVDAETRLICSMSAQVNEGEKPEHELVFSIDEYDIPLSDDLFSFEPPDGMQVVVDEPPAQQVAAPADGATLSGVITWASSGEPVVGARLTLMGGGVVTDSQGRSSREFFEHVETDRNGCWASVGVPAGHISISIRSWEFEWPAVPSFATNVGSLTRPAVVVEGHSEYTGLDFEVYKPDEYYATITANVVDEEGQPVYGAFGYLIDVEAGDVIQHLHADPQGHQKTQRDGFFDSRDIWPTIRSVRLHVGPGGKDQPYILGGVDTQPFTVEPQESYHFDVVLPYPREMTVRVVNTSGRPVEGVVAIALDSQSASPISATDWSQPTLTDSDGQEDISGMRPGEEVLIGLKRLDADEPAMLSPLVSALAHATAPTDRSKPVVEVTFDEQPIMVEGRLLLSSAVQGSFVAVYVTGQRGQLQHMPFIRTRIDEQGGFTLRGVPAGTIRLLYSATGPDGMSRRDDAFMTVEPGNRYRIEFIEEGLRVLDVEPLP